MKLKNILFISFCLIFTFNASAALVHQTEAGTTGSDRISITAEGSDDFGTSPGQVFIGSKSVTVDYWSVDSISGLTPSGQGVNLQVQYVTGGQVFFCSNTFSYDPPFVVSLSVTSGSPEGGYLLTITGDNFGANPAETTVKLGTYNAVVNSVSHQSIQCIVPEGVGKNLDLTVTVSQNTGVKTAAFSYDPPVIMNLAPTNGPTKVGDLIEVTGFNFGNFQSEIQLTIGGVTAPISEFFGDTIRCVIPAGTGQNLPVVLEVGNQSSTGSHYFSYDAPSLSSYITTGASTSGNDTLTLYGNNFGEDISKASVTINGLPAPIISGTINHDSLKCLTPEGFGTNKTLTITVDGQVAASGLFFSYDPPQLTELVYIKASTTGLDTLTINGMNFGNGAASVSIGAATGQLVPGAKTHTSIKFLIPSGQGTSLPVSVTVGLQTSNTLLFSYDAPVITSVDPVCIGRDDTLTISGENFGTISTITIDDIPLTNVLSASHTTLKVIVPEGLNSQKTSLALTITVSNQTNAPFSVDHCYSLPTAYPKMEAQALYVKSPENGIIMKSPDGSCWRLKVDNNGNLTTARADCPL